MLHFLKLIESTVFKNSHNLFTFAKVNWVVSVTTPDNFSHISGVKCLATKLLLDFISGNSSDAYEYNFFRLLAQIRLILMINEISLQLFWNYTII